MHGANYGMRIGDTESSSRRSLVRDVLRGCFRPFFAAITLITLLGFAVAPPAKAAAPTFTVGWSVYAGWNPYFYMAKSGILKRGADKYGVVIRVQRFDYAASLDAFV